MGQKINIRKLLLKAKEEVEIEMGANELSRSLYQQRVMYETVDYYKNIYPEFKNDIEHIENLEKLSDVIGFKIKNNLPLGHEYIEFNNNIDALTKHKFQY